MCRRVALLGQGGIVADARSSRCRGRPASAGAGRAAPVQLRRRHRAGIPDAPRPGLIGGNAPCSTSARIGAMALNPAAACRDVRRARQTGEATRVGVQPRRARAGAGNARDETPIKRGRPAMRSSAGQKGCRVPTRPSPCCAVLRRTSAVAPAAGAARVAV